MSGGASSFLVADETLSDADDATCDLKNDRMQEYEDELHTIIDMASVLNKLAEKKMWLADTCSLPVQDASILSHPDSSDTEKSKSRPWNPAEVAELVRLRTCESPPVPMQVIGLLLGRSKKAVERRWAKFKRRYTTDELPRPATKSSHRKRSLATKNPGDDDDEYSPIVKRPKFV